MYSEHATQGFHCGTDNLRVLAMNYNRRELWVLCPKLQIPGCMVDTPQYNTFTNADCCNMPVLHIITGSDEYKITAKQMNVYHAVIVALEHEIGLNLCWGSGVLLIH